MKMKRAKVRYQSQAARSGITLNYATPRSPLQDDQAGQSEAIPQPRLRRNFVARVPARPLLERPLGPRAASSISGVISVATSLGT